MKTTLQIAELSISKPCHEDWDKMLPEERGKFCLSCKKAVHDFTAKTTHEIFEFFRLRKFQSACVRVNSEVLQQPIIVSSSPPDKRILKRLVWFAYALYLVFGSLLFSCNSVDQNNATPTEFVYDGKSFFMRENDVVKHPDLKSGDQKRFVKRNKIVQAKVAASSPDTVYLPNVNVVGKPVLTMGDMVMGACRYYTFSVLDTPILKADTVTTANLALEDKLSAFPNPTSGQFQIHYRIAQSTPIEISVYNQAGQFIKNIVTAERIDEGEYTEQIDLSSGPAGIYFVKMQMPDKTLTRKVIVAH